MLGEGTGLRPASLLLLHYAPSALLMVVRRSRISVKPGRLTGSDCVHMEDRSLMAGGVPCGTVQHVRSEAGAKKGDQNE